jgi:DNA primase
MNELEEIKSKIDIVELVNGYAPLKQTGRNYKACCPFHSEKTPSFVVSPERQMWHCFGACGEGGDIFSFIMKADGLSFPEAVQLLADRAGVKIEKKNFQKDEAKSRYYNANELAADYYHSLLNTTEGKFAKDYLRGRGLTEEIIKDFNLGYSPLGKDALQKELARHKFTQKELEESGLIANKSGEWRDLFWKRLMFPIRDISGHTVGFSARTLEKDGIPKYINTPATKIYDKSSILYGIDLAKESIRKLDYAILVEGNMDVIASYQAGVKNAVAPSGTALTENQLRLLARLTKNLKLAFDIDFAGSQATRRAIELAWDLGFNIKVITIPSGKDPADAVSDDPKIWSKAVKDAEYVVDYLFKTTIAKYNLRETLGKKSIAKELLPMIKRIPDEIERDTYIKKLAKTLNVEEQSIRDALSKVAKPAERKIVTEEPVPVQKDQNLEMERILIGLLVILPNYLDFAETLLSGKDFRHPETGEAFSKLIKYYNNKGKFSESEFFKSLSKDERDLFGIYTMSAETACEDLDEEKKAEEIYFAAKRLKRLSLETRKRALSDEIAHLEKTGDKAGAQKALKTLQEILEEERAVS